MFMYNYLQEIIITLLLLFQVQVDLQPAHSFGIKHSPYSNSFGIGY